LIPGVLVLMARNYGFSPDVVRRQTMRDLTILLAAKEAPGGSH
jgi:hypothetical protein